MRTIVRAIGTMSVGLVLFACEETDEAQGPAGALDGGGSDLADGSSAPPPGDSAPDPESDAGGGERPLPLPLPTGAEVDVAGSRLALRFLRADGLQVPVGWTDGQRSQHCNLELLDGAPTCVPLATPLVGASTFTTPDCSASGRLYLPQSASGTGFFSEPAFLYRATDGAAKWFAPGTPLGSGTCFTTRFSRCEVGGIFCESEAFPLGPEVTAGEFVSGTEVTLPGRVIHRMADGSEAFVSWLDGTERCSPALGKDGRPYCFPLRYELSQFADPLCSQSAFINPSGAAPPPLLEAVDACTGFREAVTPVPLADAATPRPVALYQKDASGVCTHASVVSSERVYLPGAPLSVDRVPAFTASAAVGARLEARYVEREGVRHFDGFFDRTLGVRCEFKRGRSGLVCEPLERVIADVDPRTFFVDAACSATVSLVKKSSSSATCASAPSRFVRGQDGVLSSLLPSVPTLYSLTAENSCAPAPADPATYWVRGPALSLVTGEVAQ